MSRHPPHLGYPSLHQSCHVVQGVEAVFLHAATVHDVHHVIDGDGGLRNLKGGGGRGREGRGGGQQEANKGGGWVGGTEEAAKEARKATNPQVSPHKLCVSVLQGAQEQLRENLFGKLVCMDTVHWWR
jgi:hypothetical protein